MGLGFFCQVYYGEVVCYVLSIDADTLGKLQVVCSFCFLEELKYCWQKTCLLKMCLVDLSLAWVEWLS